MNPNQTYNSMKIDDMIKILFDRESQLHPKFAFLPKKINGQWIWFQTYYVQYESNTVEYLTSKVRKVVFATHTKEDVSVETLKGNIANGRLLTTRKRSIKPRR